MVFGLYVKYFLFLGVVAAGVVWLINPYREYCRTKAALRELDQKMVEQDTRNEELRVQIFRLQNDPRAIEKIAREKFGYCRPTETIYDYTSPAATARP